MTEEKNNKIFSAEDKAQYFRSRQMVIRRILAILPELEELLQSYDRQTSKARENIGQEQDQA